MPRDCSATMHDEDSPHEVLSTSSGYCVATRTRSTLVMLLGRVWVQMKVEEHVGRTGGRQYEVVVLDVEPKAL